MMSLNKEALRVQKEKITTLSHSFAYRCSCFGKSHRSFFIYSRKKYYIEYDKFENFVDFEMVYCESE